MGERKKSIAEKVYVVAKEAKVERIGVRRSKTKQINSYKIL